MQPDKAAIDETTARFFNAFTNRGGAIPDVDCLRELFIPEAVIIKNVDGSAVLYDVGSFIEPRRAILTDGSLIDFCERETAEKTNIYRHVAQRFSRYEKSWMASGERFEGSGAE